MDSSLKPRGFILLLVAVTLVLVVVSLPRAEEGNTDYHNVYLCGSKYEVPRIVVDGVVIITRIAEVASAEEEQETCKQIFGANRYELDAKYSRDDDFHTITLNGYWFGYEEGRAMIVRLGEHGIDGWARLRP